MELEFEELFELQLEDEFEFEFEEPLDELLDDELEDEFELELPATRVRATSSAAVGWPLTPSVSVSSGGVPACAPPTASAAVAMPARVVILTVLCIVTFSFITQAAP
ncbi:MAG: hypothetical protein ACKVP3_16230 [Hyphomicrobiaceae bacterium]